MVRGIRTLAQIRVSPVQRRGLQLDDDLAGAGDRVRQLVLPEDGGVAVLMQDSGAHQRRKELQGSSLATSTSS